ncbi:hypothetical protein FZ103_17350 [Streptomonospora sp. PA3]|uniref:hypothetical protein n=1 Tax=Streptomonospora sp. PA3 TaxID=2607326 RepID=UPI0012DD158A|nr:hypothetical protein [Streptomonospora sp. PA3]MUL42913.1 hypothetical protein [Streptomonospora sp. PA3]
MTTETDLTESHRRLYSASARMLLAQVDPVWRGDFWPPERARSWRELETRLAAVPTGAGKPPDPVDPACRLASRRTPADGPIGFAAAVRAWEARLDTDPGPGRTYDGAPSGRGVVLDAAWQSAVLELLAELGRRVAPGRPGYTVAQDAAGLAQAVLETAEALRAPLTAVGIGANAAGSPRPPDGEPEPAPGDEVTEADHSGLREAARAALRTVPSRADAERGDFSIRVAVCDAAADLARIDRGEDAPAWREAFAGVDPARHLVRAYHWGPGEQRPLPFAERADELRVLQADYPPPRLLDPQDPPPDVLGESGGRAALSPETALVAAELLEELAARLAPGTRVGTMHFAAYPLHLFLRGRFQRAFTAD